MSKQSLIKCIIFALPILFLLYPVLNFFQGNIWLSWGYPNHYFNLIDKHSSPFFLWRETIGEPSHPFLFNIAYYWPLKLLLIISNNAYLSWLIYVYLVFLASIISFSLYIKKITSVLGLWPRAPSLSPIASLLLGLVYASYIPLHYEGFNLRIAGVLIPFLLWLLIKVYEDARKTIFCFILSSVFTLNLIIIDSRTFIVFLLLAISQIGFLFWAFKDKKGVFRMAVFFFITLLASALLFLPLKYSQDIALNNSIQISIPVKESVLTGLFSSLKFFFQPNPLVRANWLMNSCLFFLLLLAGFGLYQIKQKQKKLFFLILFLIGFYFLFSSNWFLEYLTLNFPYGQLFRSWRIAQYLAIFLILFCFTELVNSKKQVFLLSAFVLIYFCLSVYAFSQNMIFIKQNDINPYIEINNFLKQDKENFKVLWVPEMGWFGKNSSPFWVNNKEAMQGFPENVSSQPTYWHYTNQMTHFYTWLASGIWKSQIQENEKVSNLLNILGIKYLIVHNDVLGYEPRTAQIINNLTNSKNFALVYQKDYLSVFKNLEYKAKIWLNSQENAVFCDYGLKCLEDFYEKIDFDKTTIFVTDTLLDSSVLKKINKIFTIRDFENGEEEKFYNLIINKILAENNANSIIIFSKNYFKHQDYACCLSDTHHGTYHEFFQPNEAYDYANSFDFQNCFFLLTPYYSKISLPVSIKKGDYVVLIRYMNHKQGGNFAIFSPYFNYGLNSLPKNEENLNYYSYFKNEIKIKTDIKTEIHFLNKKGVNFISLIALIPQQEFEEQLNFFKSNLIQVDNPKEASENNLAIKEIIRINPSFWQAKGSTDKPFILNFAESFSPFWKIRVFKNSIKQEERYATEGYGSINSFLIDSVGDLTLEIVYEPQEKYYSYLLFSAFSFVLIISSYYLFQKWQNKNL